MTLISRTCWLSFSLLLSLYRSDLKDMLSFFLYVVKHICILMRLSKFKSPLTIVFKLCTQTNTMTRTSKTCSLLLPLYN